MTPVYDFTRRIAERRREAKDSTRHFLLSTFCLVLALVVFYQLGTASAERRAKAVRSILLDGIKVKGRTVTVGETSPHASNRTADGRALNRRTEIVLTY